MSDTREHPPSNAAGSGAAGQLAGVRLLLAGINYWPEETGIAPYTTGLAEHLSQLGASVSVVAGFPCYPYWSVLDGYRGRLWQHEVIRGVDVHRRWHYVPRKQSAISRGWYELSFLLTSISSITLERPDAVLGIVPSLSGGILARVLARHFRVDYGLIFQDLTGRAAEQSGVVAGKRVARAVRLAEGWCARAAGAVGIVAEGFRPYLQAAGVRSGRIRRLRNWAHLESATVSRETVRADLRLPAGAVVCLHSGNMGHKQSLENVVACARLARQTDPELLFVLMGDGNRRAALEVAAAGLPNLRFLPLQPEGYFPNALAAADILLVNQRREVRDMSLPGKLTAYFASGRPVVAAVAADSETAGEIRAAGGGFIVEPDRPPALLDGIRTALRYPAIAAQLGAAGKQYASDVLASSTVLDTYTDFVRSLLTVDPRGGARSALEQTAPFALLSTH